MTRQEFEAIIKEINEANYLSIYEVEDECETFIKAEPKCVGEGLDVDKHRWYEISTTVYAMGDWFLGLSGVTDVFSEQMSISDCEIQTVAFEMVAVPSIQYIAKPSEKKGE